jgi:hypothetical protein
MCGSCGGDGGGSTYAVDAEDDGAHYVELCTRCYTRVMGAAPRASYADADAEKEEARA